MNTKNKKELAVVEKQKIFEKLHIPSNGRLKLTDCARISAALQKYEDDKELQSEIIKLMPEYVGMMKQMSSDTKDVTAMTLDKNDSSESYVYQGYQSIIDSCNERISDPNITAEERDLAYDQRMAAADKMDKKDTEGKKFKLDIHNNWMGFAGGVLLTFLIAIGVKQINSDDEA